MVGLERAVAAGCLAAAGVRPLRAGGGVEGGWGWGGLAGGGGAEGVCLRCAQKLDQAPSLRRCP